MGVCTPLVFFSDPIFSKQMDGCHGVAIDSGEGRGADMGAYPIAYTHCIPTCMTSGGRGPGGGDRTQDRIL